MPTVGYAVLLSFQVLNHTTLSTQREYPRLVDIGQ